MEKDFDRWNKRKKKIEHTTGVRNRYFYEREIWWCSLGLNIGIEYDGKHNYFERPVLIIKKFNGSMIWCVPLTSKEKNGEYFYRVTYDENISWICLSHLKTLSTKRLLRKIGIVSQKKYLAI